MSDYILIREITQNGQWGLKIERDKEFYTVIRRQFNGEVIVKGTDFDTLIALERDTKQYALVIHRECSGVWSEFWKGYFSYFDYKVDLDRCYLSFEPEVWDEYSPVYDQMPIERNILSADDDHFGFMQSYEYPSEVKTQSTTLVNPLLVPASWYEYPGAPAGNKYYLISQTWIWLYNDEITGFPVYSVSKIYRRDYGYSVSNVVGPSGDLEWVLDPDYTGEYSPGVYRWVRPYKSMDSEPHNYTSVYKGDDWYQELIVPTIEQVMLTGLKKLSKVFEYFTAIFGLTYVSNFFNDSPCPMGGNSLSLTMIQQISNLRPTTEQATKGIMKLKDLLTFIRDTFNAYWYIDSNGDFRVEHKKYFEWGLSYTAIAGITMDLGVLYPDNLLKLRRYEWSKPSLFRYETIEFTFNYSLDWIFGKIEYPQLSIGNNETTTKQVGWGTDVVGMYDGIDELPNIGWILYNIEIIGGAYGVVNTIGDVSGNAIPNARFSTANLLRDLWTWGRLLSTGNVNGVTTTFDSIDRLKKQVELSFPQCCDTIDYNGVFRTPLGDGLLDSAEYESKSGNLKAQLIYE